MPRISHLECSRCHQSVAADTPQTLCPHCAGVLYVRYDLSSAKGTAVRDRISSEASTAPSAGMWRYRAVLPFVEPVTLGEGWTPMLQSKRNRNVYVKEEGANPTGTLRRAAWPSPSPWPVITD